MQKTYWRRIVLVVFSIVLFGSVGTQQLMPEARGQQPKVPRPDYPVHPDDLYLLDKLDELPPAQPPLYEAPILRPDPKYASRSEEERRKLAEMIQSNKEIIYTSGKETAGSLIIAAEKEIQLPNDIYVDAYVTSILCEPIPEIHCPLAPIYGLAKLNEDRHVRIEADGSVYTWGRTSAEEVEQDRKVFQFVLDILKTELRVDESK